LDWEKWCVFEALFPASIPTNNRKTSNTESPLSTFLTTNRNPLADTDAETNVYCSRIALASLVELSGDYGVKEAW